MLGPTGRVRRLSETEIERYDLVSSAIARRAVLIRVPVLPPKAHGMTSGRLMFLIRDEPTDGSSQLIAHELIHVRQFKDLGRLWFGLTYLWGYGRNLVKLRNHQGAYRSIPHEREAYAAAAAWAVRQRRTPDP